MPRSAGAVDLTYGNYMGSGRACYGMLTITARRITWMTPFSLCGSSPYAIRDRQNGPAGLRVTYEVLRPSAKCRYRALVLSHDGSEEADRGWGVVGYPSLDAAIHHRKDTTLGCYLYR